MVIRKVNESGRIRNAVHRHKAKKNGVFGERQKERVKGSHIFR